MSSDFFCHRKNFSTLTEGEVCAILQPFVLQSLAGHLPDGVALSTGEMLNFTFRRPAPDCFTIWVTRDHRTPGITALLRALADAGFLLHYSGTDGYIDPYSDEWTNEESQ